MTATTPLTCAALYAYDDVFRSAIAKWVADRRCPIALADYLRERELHAAADCAEWCATEPDRPVWKLKDWEADVICGPMPRKSSQGNWYWQPTQYTLLNANEVPNSRFIFTASGLDDFSKTAEVEILRMLDNWNPST